MGNYILNKEKDELLYTYFSAFVNLYGRIELDKAMEIIKSQNCNIKLTDEEINIFSAQYEKGDLYRGCYFYIDEIYSGEDDSIVNKEIIAEYLTISDMEKYFDFCDEQEKYDYYIPAKTELLKYANEFYMENTDEKQKFIKFLSNDMGFDFMLVQDILDDLSCMIQIDDVDPNEALDRIAILAQGKFNDFKNQEQALKYGELYTDFYNNTRLHRYRGHTPKEVGEEYVVDTYYNNKRVNKIGRNDPCPCGSGKKYKKCCIDKWS
ncbi:MAG: SEC-C domain-containing protein [Clostridia bacterium]|nr:SEC-C domain-containing protein [Clostridia bacterium]